ncbi:Amino acid transporter transmembrane [Penicillium macrosclerotiorum]|uniref:Amino acid transporter transmembrane n=1 Tax=Penicillium macrosclerotiorum TaxID=303699 RepID=UPI002547D506|nr:Amino acid transporter transmembrane [Penicillium macrosclerotiorum]KAJ5683583.1 Amino acid transporter transmembrane [Penicillium macrosclerotiorum]
MMSEKKQDDSLNQVPSQIGEVTEGEHDAVFGEITGDGPNYRNVGWLGTAVLMMKTQIGLGVLSIPVAFDSLGVVPGVICLCAIAAITTWSDYIIGVFKLRHREVYGIDDVGELLCGRLGRVVLGTAFVLWWIFVAGSGMLSISIALNAVSDHAICTAVYVAVAAIVAFLFGSIRTLGRISWIAWLGLFCILTSILIVTIAVGIQERPSAAPQEGVWVPDYKIVNSDVSFTDAISAISTIVFAYAGTPAFFSIASEMRDPGHYNRALMICQSVVTCFYLAIGIVIYYYCGSYVSSPALGSAGPVVKKVSYGFALPGLLASTLLFVHITGKYIFIRILHGSRHLVANTMVHWLVWLGCTVGVSLIAYIIASAIPVFSDLVSLVGALLGTPMCFQPMAGMWLYDNWNKGRVHRTTKWTLMVCWCAFIIVAGTFLMVGGTYGSIVSIIDNYKAEGGSAAWSCADNST